MKLVTRLVRNRLIISLCCVALAIVGTVAMALTALGGHYVAMGILIPFTAFGYYGIVFFFAAYGRARMMRACLLAVTAGNLSVEGISRCTGLKPKYVYRYLAVAISRRYIINLALDDNGLVVI